MIAVNLFSKKKIEVNNLKHLFYYRSVVEDRYCILQEVSYKIEDIEPFHLYLHYTIENRLYASYYTDSLGLANLRDKAIVKQFSIFDDLPENTNEDLSED